MFCILCINYLNDFIYLFGDEGIKLDAVNVITKHFWVQPIDYDENKRTICKQCWNTLSSFHKFYIQVEKAHINLVSTVKFTKDGLKLEENIAAHDVGEIEYEPFTESINTEVKLEDGEVPLAQENRTLGAQDLLSTTNLTDIKKNEFQDSEKEIPLADLRIQKQITNSNSEEISLSEKWQLNGSIGHSQSKEKSLIQLSPPNTSKKRKRPCKSQPLKSIPIEADKNIVAHCVSEIDKNESSTDLINTGVKVEDAALSLEEKIPTSAAQEIENCTLLPALEEDDSDDPDFELTLADLKKQRQTSNSDSELVDLSESDKWRCNDSNDGGSGSESKAKTDKQELPSKTGKKRGQNLHDSSRKQTTEEKVKKQEILQEYYSIIEKNMKLSCNICLLPLANFLDLKNHYRTEHNERWHATCCGTKFRKPSILVDHIYTHLNPEHFKCDKCEAKYKGKYGLKRHMNVKHSESNGSHVCNICGKVAPHSLGLQRHHWYVHKCEKSHKCPMCSKAFKTTGDLKEHKITHTREVPYACPHCPKVFNFISNMHSHRKRMHRKEWEDDRRRI